MLADHFWYVHDWDDFGLWFLRLCLVIFSVGTLILINKIIRHRVRWRRIPIGVRVYTVSWTVYWGSIASYLLITNENPFGEWFRTLYGTGYLGMLSGLVWCLWYATKNISGDDVLCHLHAQVMAVLSDQADWEDVDAANCVERERGKAA